MLKNIKNFFNQLSSYLKSDVAPIANALDHDRELLKIAYQKLVSFGNLRLLIPSQHGGLGGEQSERMEYNMLMAQFSGALLFLHTQHQYSIGQLKKLLPHDKISKTLTELSAQQRGVGVSNIINKSVLQIQQTDQHLLLSGKLPWVTGFNYFSQVLLSFDFNEDIYYVWLPFQEVIHSTSSLQISPPIETAVFSAANTVSIELRNWPIAKNDIIALQPKAAMQPAPPPPIYNFAGAAFALLKIASQSRYANHPEAQINLQLLQTRWQAYYQRVLSNETDFFALRSDGLYLAQDCAVFARIVCGGEGLLASHPLTRISREIWQYTVAGYSNDQLEAYLKVTKESG
ncbi:MAG TPA: hypothetical protein VHE99_03940 [Gammaproteobacteria bacterium]|nr:hypothetical protein [Gammaproteobacteria bacterium]